MNWKEKMLAVAAGVAAVAWAGGAAGKPKVPPPRLAGARAVYAAAYQELRKGLLDKDGDDMSATEALEAVTVKFSQAFDRTDERLDQMARRTKSLEDDAAQMKRWQRDAEAFIEKLEKRVKALEERVSAQESDLTKLFDWARDTEDDLHNGVRYGSTKSQIDTLTKQMNDEVGGVTGLPGRIKRLETAAGNIENSINDHAVTLRNIINALSRMR